MPATISQSARSAQRREKFREYIRKLNPTEPARLTIESGLVVEDLHGSLFRTLAARADLEPGSQQLLAGGTGSGKTTELLMAEQWLKQQGQTLAIYIDISSETDLSGLNSGALLAGFGLHLTRAFWEKSFDSPLAADEKKALKEVQKGIKEFAFGKTNTLWVPDDEDYREPDQGGQWVTHKTPGKLNPPFPALQRDIQAIRVALETFVDAVRAHALDVVVIFDGLDRLLSPDKFWSIVHQDLRIFRLMGVAVIAAAPLSVLYGEGRFITEHFDRVHHIRAFSATDDNYLKAVLTHRGGDDLLEPDEMQLICFGSGGVLRDIIALASDAGEAAYI
jgi:hypothetical protein